jgi:hypothetical protein
MFCNSERVANCKEQTHSGIATRRICNSRASCELQGAKSFWDRKIYVLQFQNEWRTARSKLILGSQNLRFASPERVANCKEQTHSGSKSYVLQLQNELRTARSKLILGSQHLGFAIPERVANCKEQTHAGIAKSTFCKSRASGELQGAKSIPGSQNLRCASLERVANCTGETHSGIAKPRMCDSRTSCELQGAHLFWDHKTCVSQLQYELRTAGAKSFWHRAT